MLELEKELGEERGAGRGERGRAHLGVGEMEEKLGEGGEGLGGAAEGEGRRRSAEEALEIGVGKDWGERGNEELESEERG